MHERAYARKSCIVLQPETCDEHFEGHLGVNMGELRPIEVEAQGLLRTVLDSLEPEKPGIRIDESADEPGRGDPIDPQMLAGGPYTCPVILAIATFDLFMSGTGFIRSKVGIQRAFRVFDGVFYLLAWLAGEKIPGGACCDLAPERGKLLSGFGLGKPAEISFERGEPLAELGVLSRAIEQLLQ